LVLDTRYLQVSNSSFLFSLPYLIASLERMWGLPAVSNQSRILCVFGWRRPGRPTARSGVPTPGGVRGQVGWSRTGPEGGTFVRFVSHRIKQSNNILSSRPLQKLLKLYNTRNFFPRFSFLHSASFPVFPATSAAVHPAKGGLYGYFADQHSSVMCARNASLSSLQGYRAGSERGILDVSDVQSCHYASGAIAGSA
jgi:hypothetical protein